MTLIGRIVAYALLALLLVSGVYNVIQYIELSHAKEQVADLTTKNTNLTTDLNNCKGNLDKQNKAVADAGKETQAKQDALNDLGKQIADQQAKNKALIDQLAKQPAPKTCNDATKYLKDGLGDFK